MQTLIKKIMILVTLMLFEKNNIRRDSKLIATHYVPVLL